MPTAPRGMQRKLGTGHKTLDPPRSALLRPVLSIFTFDACQNEFWYLKWKQGVVAGQRGINLVPNSNVALLASVWYYFAVLCFYFSFYLYRIFLFFLCFFLLFFCEVLPYLLPQTGCAFDWLAFVVYLIIRIRSVGLLQIDFQIEDWRLPPSAHSGNSFLAVFIFMACKFDKMMEEPPLKNWRCPCVFLSFD